MAKWKPPSEGHHPHSPQHRPGMGFEGHPPPPHIAIYDGLSHVSSQLEELQKELEDVKAMLRRLADTK